MNTIEMLYVENEIRFNINQNMYDLEIIESSIIPFTPFSSIQIEKENGFFSIIIIKDSDSQVSPQELKKAFLNNLTHESLRRKIADKTEMERNLILSYAFSNSKLME